MKRLKKFGVSIGIIASLSLIIAVSRAQTPAAAPVYTADGKLQFPRDYRTWVYLSTGMDMSYMPGARTNSVFDNVFVNREAYDSFQQMGTWPDKTMLMLEVRRAEDKGSIVKSGHFQTDVARTEVHVKDAARFGGGWGFFVFVGQAPATVMPRTADCYSCHHEHGAVDTTFVQFYPTLLPLARDKKTLSAEYLADEKTLPK